MLIWNRIVSLLDISKEDRCFATELFQEIKEGLPVSNTQSSLLEMSKQSLAVLYSMLEESNSIQNTKSLENDSSWMLKADFCWINARACTNKEAPGSFIEVCKILPAISANALLLAPFHPVQFDLEYAPDSVFCIDPSLVDDEFLSLGVNLEEQLIAFISAAKLLGKTVGYELLPYMARLGRTVLEKPELFRWIATDEYGISLAYANPGNPYTKQDRERESSVLHIIVKAILDGLGLDTMEYCDTDSEEISVKKSKAYYTIIKQCMKNGLWPVPAHARNGIGIPSFVHVENPNDFPVFAYRDIDGEDVGSDAYGVVAPFAFHDNMPVNSIPDNSPTENADAINFYKSIFNYWRDKYGFDFVRYNAVDRLFSDSLDDGRIPISDRPTPIIVKTAIEFSRGGHNGTGAIASRKGSELTQYLPLGFDLTMGNEAVRKFDKDFMKDEFELYEQLCLINKNANCASVCFAVDLPETAAPRLWSAPLIKIIGATKLHQRHAVSRFLSVGKARRPMFEVMGFQDASSGLYAAGLSTKKIDWADNKDFALNYRSIEKLYAIMRTFLDNAFIAERFLHEKYSWWQIKDTSHSRLIVAVVTFDFQDNKTPVQIEIPIGENFGNIGKQYRLLAKNSETIYVSDKVIINLPGNDFAIIDIAPY